MSRKNLNWQSTNTSVGTTDSERYLVQLAKKVFLSLWSYPNVFTDEGRCHGKGDGKELCDLLVAFGNDIILFSDKHSKFSNHENINVAWFRWYRYAIRGAAKQLKGAETWINRFPERVFLDRSCEIPLPIKLPSPLEARIHLVAVTRGSSNHSQSYWGRGSSGSLFIDTSLIGDQHMSAPFRVGWPLPNKRFVHVFDETTLDIVLNELDTVSDFVEYLKKKESLFSIRDVDCSIAGEEELIAIYLSNFDFKKNEHFFPSLPEGAALILGEGDWLRLLDSPGYASRRKANEISYTWDDLIEFHSHHIMHESAVSYSHENSSNSHERVMRIMASENRITRRVLGEAFHVANDVKQKGLRFTRTVLSQVKGRAYVFMSIPKPENYSFEDYLERRRSDLLLYVDGCKLEFEKLSEIIGIVFEPGQRVLNSIDFLYVDFGENQLPTEFINEIKPQLKNANMWDKKSMKSGVIRHLPFPKVDSIIFNIYIWLRHKLKKLVRYLR